MELGQINSALCAPIVVRRVNSVRDLHSSCRTHSALGWARVHWPFWFLFVLCVFCVFSVFRLRCDAVLLPTLWPLVCEIHDQVKCQNFGAKTFVFLCSPVRQRGAEHTNTATRHTQAQHTQRQKLYSPKLVVVTLLLLSVSSSTECNCFVCLYWCVGAKCCCSLFCFCVLSIRFKSEITVLLFLHRVDLFRNMMNKCAVYFLSSSLHCTFII